MPARPQVRLVLVDDHPVVREGIRQCLKDFRTLKIVAEARDGREGIRKVRATRPDVVLLDLAMPKMGGLEALPAIRAAHPAARVVILTVHNTREHLQKALTAKVDGYLLKDTAPAEYAAAIRTVMRGELFISPGLAQSSATESNLPHPATFALTDLEFQYLTLAARGQRPAEISVMLHCPLTAVRSLRRNVFRKLNLRDMAMLAHFALKNGL